MIQRGAGGRHWTLACSLLWSLGAALSCGSETSTGECSSSSSDVYSSRIVPLVTSDQPSTCSQCHLGGLDLEQYVRDDPCEAMACLLADGLVNLEHPEQSVLLTWIQRAEPEAELITEEVIQAEYDAVAEWIGAEAQCGHCAEVQCGRPTSGSCALNEDTDSEYSRRSDPGDCSEATLERLFRGTVYKWRGRCSPCHFQEEETATDLAPRFFFRTGSCEVASRASYNAQMARGLFSSPEPAESPLLVKPLARIYGGLEHGGHDKIVIDDDPAYPDFLHFLERYAGCSAPAP